MNYKLLATLQKIEADHKIYALFGTTNTNSIKYVYLPALLFTWFGGDFMSHLPEPSTKFTIKNVITAFKHVRKLLKLSPSIPSMVYRYVTVKCVDPKKILT